MPPGQHQAGQQKTHQGICLQRLCHMARQLHAQPRTSGQNHGAFQQRQVHRCVLHSRAAGRCCAEQRRAHVQQAEHGGHEKRHQFGGAHGRREVKSAIQVKVITPVADKFCCGLFFAFYA